MNAVDIKPWLNSNDKRKEINNVHIYLRKGGKVIGMVSPPNIDNYKFYFHMDFQGYKIRIAIAGFSIEVLPEEITNIIYNEYVNLLSLILELDLIGFNRSVLS